MDTATLVSRLTEAHYAFLARWPGFQRTDGPGAVLIANDLIPAGYRNHAARVHVDAQDVDTFMNQAARWLTAHGRSLVVQLDPTTEPCDLAARLIQHGLRLTTQEAWLVYEGPLRCHSERSEESQGRIGMLHAAQHDSPLAIRAFAADDDAAVQAYIDCYNLCFGMSREVGVRWGEAFRGSLVDPCAVHYLGEYAGDPASAMSLYYAGDLGCVYNVGTFPQFRGRGAASALLARLLVDARALGVTTVFLQTQLHGKARPLYERAGFRVQFVRDWYAL